MCCATLAISRALPPSSIAARKPVKIKYAGVCSVGKKLSMRHEVRYSSLLLVVALLLGFGASSAAQQGEAIRFEDFSNASYANQHLHQNYSQNYSGRNGSLPYLATYQGNSVLRLTDGGSSVREASTAYFNVDQPVLYGFTTWFAFQAHRPLGYPNPGDGIAFIIQNSSAPDMSMGATEPMGPITALGAGGNTNYQKQAGALGYAGIDDSLVIEFDTVQDAWDPNANHIAVQTCGTGVNTPVHDPGTYQIGNNSNVTSCLYYYNEAPAINTTVPPMGGICSPGSQVCSDGSIHNVVIVYAAPPPNSPPCTPGTLQIYLDPPLLPGHVVVPETTPTITTNYSINCTSDGGLGLNLRQGALCPPNTLCSAYVGFTASQPGEIGYTADAAQDVLGWTFTPNQITQEIAPPGGPTNFGFGVHQTTVTYPFGSVIPSGTQMTVVANAVDRNQFYVTRLLGTDFANEQCIVYQGASNNMLKPNASGDCIVYTYTCQDSSGDPVLCPLPPEGGEIGVVTEYTTSDQVTSTNADYLETCYTGVANNDWFSIFESFQNIGDPQQLTSGGSKGIGGYPFGDLLRKFPQGSCEGTMSADIVATFRPSNGGKK